MQKWVYHERQSESMCAVHCLNALFQGPVINEVELAEIARDLDMKEASLYKGFGEIVGVKGSMNVSEDGNFSIQVIIKAIEARGLKVDQIKLIDSSVLPKENDPLDDDPNKCVHAYICWLKHHWICFRKVHGFWFDMNSLNSVPQYLSYFRIELNLGELKRQGYYVYKVTGKIPECDLRSNFPDNETLHGKWLPLITDEKGIPSVLHDESPKQSRRKKPAKKNDKKRSNEMSFEEQMKLAISESLKSSSVPDKKIQKSDEKKRNTPPSSNNSSGNGLTMSEDEELQYAIALSLSMDKK